MIGSATHVTVPLILSCGRHARPPAPPRALQRPSGHTLEQWLSCHWHDGVSVILGKAGRAAQPAV